MLQCLFHPGSPLLLWYMEPVIFTGLDLIRKIFKCIVKDISHIHRLKTIFLSLLQTQTILQEMCIRTGCKLLQSGNTSFQKGSIQSPRHCLSNRFFLSTVKDCIHQAVKLLIPVRLLRIPSGQHLLLSIIGSFSGCL